MPHPPLLLALELDAALAIDLAGLVAAGRAADEAGIDLLLLDDDLVHGGDASLALSALAVVTDRVGLVPTITTTHTEPFHVATVLATLDHASHGRAGWAVAVSTTSAAAAAIGRRAVAAAADLHEEAAEVVEVVRALWDSWEDDAIVRDVATGRFIDRQKLHHIAHEGRFLEVMGPAITPRPPQGHPVVVVTAEGPDATALAARTADLVVVPGRDSLDPVVEQVALAGRPRDHVRLLVRLDASAHDDLAGAAEAAWHEGADGVLLRGIDADEVASVVEPELRDRGTRTAEPVAAATLRERLSLPVPTNRFAVA